MAISGGDTRAMNNLASCYLNMCDYVSAINYYLMAIKGNNLESISNLSILYEHVKLHARALQYYLLAIDNGCTLAHKYLNEHGKT